MRQARENRLVYVILAECRLILRLRSQTTMSMTAPLQSRGVAHIICRGGEAVEGRLDYAGRLPEPLSVSALDS